MSRYPHGCDPPAQPPFPVRFHLACLQEHQSLYAPMPSDVHRPCFAHRLVYALQQRAAGIAKIMWVMGQGERQHPRLSMLALFDIAPCLATYPLLPPSMGEI